MLSAVILFIVGLACLIKGGGWFVDGAVGVARRFEIPELVIGATMVSIGTTLPEVMVSASSAVTGHGEMAYGNAIGSIICNSALIAAVPIIVRPGPANGKSLRIPTLFFAVASAIYASTAYATGYFSRMTGVLLLAVFIVYVATALWDAGRNRSDGPAGHVEESLAHDVVVLVVSAILIAVGADLLVDNGVVIAQAAGVPESVIALTFVALGTSLPELVTALTALAKGHGSLSLGNIVGANMFNLVLVSGLSITLAPFRIPQAAVIAGQNASLVLDVPVMFLVMALLVLPVLVRKKTYRLQGLLLLATYVAFCAIQFNM